MHRVVLLDDRVRDLRRRRGEQELRLLHEASHALPVLFMSSAIHDRVGVEDVLVELAREVMSHVCAAVAIASQRRTSRRPLTIGPTARSRSAPGLSNILCRRDSRCIQDPSQQISCMAVMPFPILLTDVCLQSSRRRLDPKDPALTAVARSVRDRERSPARSSLRRAQPSLRCRSRARQSRPDRRAMS